MSLQDVMDRLQMTVAQIDGRTIAAMLGVRVVSLAVACSDPAIRKRIDDALREIVAGLQNPDELDKLEPLRRASRLVTINELELLIDDMGGNARSPLN